MKILREVHNFGFIILFTLAYKVPLCCKITTWAKLLDNVHMELVSAVDTSLIGINVTKCRADITTAG